MATINDFGIPEVGSGTLQPKQKFKWRVQFANLAGGADTQNLSMQVHITSRPSISFDEIQLDRYTNRSYVAGKYTWEPLNLTVEDDVRGLATTIIQEQLQKQQFLIGAEGQFLATAGEGSQYKFVTMLDMLDGNETIIERWTMEGCFFQAVDWTDLDYAASEAVEINLTIRFDHARQSIGGYDQGQGVALGGAGRDLP